MRECNCINVCLHMMPLLLLLFLLLSLLLMLLLLLARSTQFSRSAHYYFFLFISLHKFYDQRIHLCFPSSIETRNVRRTVRYFGHSITLKLWLPIYDLLMHFSFHRMNDSSPCRQWLPFRTFHSIKFDRKKRHISTGRAATMWETVDVFFILTFSVRDGKKTMFVFQTRKW